MVVTGFPTRAEPHRGIFNLRTSKMLGSLVDLTVLFLRAWLPWRSPSSNVLAPAIVIAAPQVPASKLIGNRLAMALNLLLYQRLAYHRVTGIVQDSDLIYAVGAAPAGVIVSDWARRARRHLVLNATGSDVNSLLPQINGIAGIKGWERHVHGVVCQSNALRETLLRMYPHIPNVRTYYRGVNLDMFSPSREAFGPFATRPPVRYLYLGGFAPYSSLPTGSNTKGGWTLLRAWQKAEPILAASGASLLVCGPGSITESIRRWRASLRHPELVHVQGVLDPDSVPGFIRGSDAILIPSMNEGLPNVSIEAAACARPVFGSDTGGLREVVVHGETGLLLPPGDVDAWSSALACYAVQSQNLSQMGVRARRRMEKMFDSSAYAPKVVEVFREAIELPLAVLPAAR